MFGKKEKIQEETQSITINDEKEDMEEKEEVKEVIKEEILPENYVIVNSGEIVSENIYRYVITTNQRLKLGLQEEN